MRPNYLLPVTMLSFAALMNAQTVEQRLKWAQESIDGHAVTHHFEPPARSSETRWEVEHVDGCTLQLKETDHREAADSVVTKEGVYGLSEDKVVTWTFDLTNLQPQFVIAGTLGGPHLRIFSVGDVFHSKSDTVRRVVKKDGTPVSTDNWSAAGTAENLWIYFDAPGADNIALVKRLEINLRHAVQQCGIQNADR
jgi:hypothetical protein